MLRDEYVDACLECPYRWCRREQDSYRFGTLQVCVSENRIEFRYWTTRSDSPRAKQNENSAFTQVDLEDAVIDFDLYEAA